MICNQETGFISGSTLLSSFIGFLLGLLSGVITEILKRRQDKQRLINLFQAELRRAYIEIDSKKSAPVGELFARGKYELLGVRDVMFSHLPEYEIEVYNARLFETEGVRLAQHLGRSGREKFWAAYGHLRDAEAIRLVLRQFPSDDSDYPEYQKVFVALVRKASDALSHLWDALEKERSFVERLRDFRSG